MDIVGMIFDYLPAGNAILVIIGMLIGWHLPEPFWAKVLWAGLMRLVAKAKEAALAGFIAVKNRVIKPKVDAKKTTKKKK